MAKVHPEGNESRNHDLDSHRSSMSSVNVSDRDEEIMPQADYLELKPNNHIYSPEVRTRYPIIAEILKRHPLWTALNDSVQVPLIYVQQFWKHLEFHPDEGNPHFTSKIDHFDTSFEVSKLRRLLGLPKETDRPDRQEIDVFVTESQLLQDIRSLGYSRELIRISDFNKKFLPPVYCTLFTILNRCLTGKNSGIDTGSIFMLTLFHGVVYDRHYDYAQLIFNEIEEAVAGKHKRKYLPFQRFLQRLVKSAMRRNVEIPRRDDHELGPVSYMQFLKYSDEQFNFEQPLLPEVVAYADQTVPCVIEYVRKHALTVRPRPVGPTHGANSRGEGIEQSRDLEHGVQDQGAPRENVNERGTSVGGTVLDSATAADSTVLETETANSPIYFEQEDMLDIDGEVLESEDLEEESDDDDDDDDDEVYPFESEEEPEREVDLQEPSSGNDSDDDGDDDSDDAHVHLIPRHGGPRPRDPIFEQSSSDEEEESEVQATNFALVENANVILGDAGRNENGERETRSKEQEDPSLASISQVATSIAGEHMLPPSIEKEVVDLATQNTPPPSHSSTSQQVDVSQTHGEIAQTLLASHSEMADIETDRRQPPSTSIVSTSSLSPFASHSILSRTQITTQSVGSLSGPTGTSVVTPFIGASRGTEGSPAMTMSLPIMNAGTTVATTVGQTGNLRGPDVLVHLENIVSKKLLENALRVVHAEYVKQTIHAEYVKQTDAQKSMIQNLSSEVQKLIKGKYVAQEPEVHQVPPPPPPQVQRELSTDELKSMLLARLLSEGNSITSEKADLVGVLGSQAEAQAQAQAQTVTKSDLLDMQISIQKMIDTSSQNLKSSIDSLAERVSKLEETCKTRANLHKRKHDDPHHDHHEGGKG